MVGFTFPNHPLQRAVRREFQVVVSNGDEFGSARQEVVAEREEGAVARARERVGLDGICRGQSIATVSVSVTIMVRGMSRYLRIRWGVSGAKCKGKCGLPFGTFAAR